jgi:hypothetical protein
MVVNEADEIVVSNPSGRELSKKFVSTIAGGAGQGNRLMCRRGR